MAGDSKSCAKLALKLNRMTVMVFQVPGVLITSLTLYVNNAKKQCWEVDIIIYLVLQMNEEQLS